MRQRGSNLASLGSRLGGWMQKWCPSGHLQEETRFNCHCLCLPHTHTLTRTHTHTHAHTHTHTGHWLPTRACLSVSVPSGGLYLSSVLIDDVVDIKGTFLYQCSLLVWLISKVPLSLLIVGVSICVCEFLCVCMYVCEYLCE